MRILIDFGHGANDNTQGKHSPETDIIDTTVYKGYFREGNFNRAVGTLIGETLKDYGYTVDYVTMEDKDIPLEERVSRINTICEKYGAKECLLVSVHSNAAGNSLEWRNARGTTVFVSKNASMASKSLAKTIYDAAAVMGFAGNRSVPPEHYWVANYFILKNTKCPAVLTENLFYDNKEDLKILTSEEGRKQIADYHIAGIINHINKQKQ